MKMDENKNVRRNGFREFIGGIIPFWRNPEYKWLKAAVYIGLIIHVAFFISLSTYWWNPFFYNTSHYKVPQATDFFAVYLAGHDLASGGSIYTTATDHPGFGETVPYFYPFRYLPTAAYIGVALNAFNPWTAYWLWVVFYEALFFTGILWLGYSFGTMRHLHIAAALYLFFTPWYPEIYMGQFNFLQSVFILGMLITASSGRLLPSGVWWALSVLWKVNTVICFPALLRIRLWKPLIWLALLIIITCGPYFLMHPGDASKFVLINFRLPGESAENFPIHGLVTFGNYGFQGLIARLYFLVNFGGDTEPSFLPHAVSMIIFLLVSIWATIRAKDNRFPELLCLWVTTYFLVYTDVWEVQYVMLLPVIAYLYLKRPNIILWPIWLAMIFPSMHHGFYNIILPNWDLPFIKPVGSFALYIYCVYSTMRNVVAVEPSPREL